MTILMTFFGLFVFIVSSFTVGFKQAWKRLAAFTVTGFVIDVLIVIVSLIVSFALTH
jgi:hypothetical protein